MRGLWACLMGALSACAPKLVEPPARQVEDLMPCDEAGEQRVVSRVDGGLVVVEAIFTRYGCTDVVVGPPKKLAEIRLRPEQPSCPIGQLGVQVWPHGGYSVEPSLREFLAARPREGGALQTELQRFSRQAQAYVIGCPEGRPVEWLFVEVPEPGRPNDAWPEKLGFFDGARVRDYPGQENVVFPDMGSPPLPSGVSADEYEASQTIDEAEPVPPQVTSTGCPAEQVDAQWMVRHYGSHQQPPGRRAFPGPETVERWWLRLDAATARLVYEKQRRPKSGAGEWTCSEATTVVGTVSRRGKTLTLTFGSTVATCREDVLSVAPATAKRFPTPLPQREDEEGCDRYRWATAQRAKTKALVCTGELPLDALQVFGPPPGLERLSLLNDCMDSSEREALRLVPADGHLESGM